MKPLYRAPSFRDRVAGARLEYARVTRSQLADLKYVLHMMKPGDASSKESVIAWMARAKAIEEELALSDVERKRPRDQRTGVPKLGALPLPKDRE